MGLVVTQSLRMKYYRIKMKNTKTGKVWYRSSQQGFEWSPNKEAAWQFSGGSIKETLKTTRSRQNWPYIIIESEEV